MNNTLPTRTYHDRIEDAKLLAEIEKNNPGSALEPTAQFDHETLKKIGIDYLGPNLATGYLKVLDSDFIVEEITRNGEVLTIDLPELENHLPYLMPGMSIFRATLVKKGMSTVEAVERIAEALNIPVSCVKYAGIKDAKAITAQEISISRISNQDIVKLKDLPNIFLKDWRASSTPIDVGQIKGNRFTIIIRTENKVDEEKLKAILDHIRENGFLNFFSFQRFGHRLLNTELGKLVLTKKYEEAVKLYFTATNEFESPYYHEIRKKITDNWGNWNEIIKILSPFKTIFYYERAMAELLSTRSNDFYSALYLIQSQTQLFVYAYFSYYFNQLLSIFARDGKSMPETLPLYRPSQQTQNIYFKYLDKKEFASLIFSGQFPFLMIRKEYDIPTRIKPQIHSYKVLDKAVVLEFSLDKGAYATTFLHSIFDLRQGIPEPVWLSKEEIDSKQVLAEI